MTKIENLKIIFFGSDQFVAQVLEKLIIGFDVVGVVTSKDSAILKIAEKEKIKTFTPEKLDEKFNSELTTLNSELIVVASYGKIIPSYILDTPKYGAINIHPSLLPKYRGPSPVPTTILNGDAETGVTLIKMDAEMDHGPIILANKIKLSGQENYQELVTKLFQLGIEGLIKIVPDFIEGTVKLQEQNHKKATYCQRMTKDDGYFDIDTPPSPKLLDRMIRAFYPWPGVWTKWNNKIVKFYPNKKIQMEGKNILSLKDFSNGYPNFPLKQLGLI